MLVSTTRELIEKLQDYEKRNGVGAIRSIGFYCAGDRKDNYVLSIANNSTENEVLNDENFRVETIVISAVDEDLLFSCKT